MSACAASDRSSSPEADPEAPTSSAPASSDPGSPSNDPPAAGVKAFKTLIAASGSSAISLRQEGVVTPSGEILMRTTDGASNWIADAAALEDVVVVRSAESPEWHGAPRSAFGAMESEIWASGQELESSPQERPPHLVAHLDFDESRTTLVTAEQMAELSGGFGAAAEIITGAAPAGFVPGTDVELTSWSLDGEIVAEQSTGWVDAADGPLGVVFVTTYASSTQPYADLLAYSESVFTDDIEGVVLNAQDRFLGSVDFPDDVGDAEAEELPNTEVAGFADRSIRQSGENPEIGSYSLAYVGGSAVSTAAAQTARSVANAALGTASRVPFALAGWYLVGLTVAFAALGVAIGLTALYAANLLGGAGGNAPADLDVDVDAVPVEDPAPQAEPDFGVEITEYQDDEPPEPAEDCIEGGKAAKEEILRRFARERHHLATKYGKPGEYFKEVFARYGFSINDPINLLSVIHPRDAGHSPQYHDWIARTINWIDERTNGDPREFERLFRKYIRDRVKNDPTILSREYFECHQDPNYWRDWQRPR